MIDRDQASLGTFDFLDEGDVGQAQTNLRSGRRNVFHLRRDHLVIADLAAGQRVGGLGDAVRVSSSGTASESARRNSPRSSWLGAAVSPDYSVRQHADATSHHDCGGRNGNDARAVHELMGMTDNLND